MNKQELKTLLEKFDAGQCTPEEIGLLESWYLVWLSEETIDFEEAEAERRVDQIWDRLKLDVEIKKKIMFWPRIAAAAVLLLSLSLGLYFYQSHSIVRKQELVQQDVAPGGNKAYLTLADGKKITLTDVANGELAKQAGVAIRKSADGQLIYQLSDRGAANDKPAYNTIETPNGGQYQVILPDGTKVWLNAASVLKFPSSFAGLKERSVDLSGEGYFEVSHNAKQPFIVKSRQQEVLVLGTHFNINSYTGETTITTLLKGAVMVRRSGKIANPLEGKDFAVLKPGEQSELKEKITISPADLEMATAWKDGLFIFNKTKLQNILMQLSRWYNVHVDYSDVPKDRALSGTIKRESNLSSVLKMLYETSRINFIIEENTIKMKK
nr:FecR family protein [Pedobacter sp. ASV19]